jgi:hypothetical protein
MGDWAYLSTYTPNLEAFQIYFIILIRRMFYWIVHCVEYWNNFEYAIPFYLQIFSKSKQYENKIFRD